jgi:O-antigen/teichoic acid export membrane protein
MLFASLAGGGLLALVHRVAPDLKEAGDYGLFTNILNMMPAMAFPSLGLAAVFAQMTAAAASEDDRRNVAVAAKHAAAGMIVYWAALCLSGWVAKGPVMSYFKLTNPLPLLWLAPTLLVTLLMPIAFGIVQGRQDFLWAGMSSMSTGLGRLVVTWAAVAWIGASAGWAICGVFVGLLAGFLPVLWASKPIWSLRGGTFRFGPWLKDLVPMTAGLAAMQFLFSLDQIASRAFLSEATNDLYGAAGVVGRVVMWIAAPLVTVMFPKLIADAAKGEDRKVLFQAMGATLAVAGGAALVCSILPSVPLLALQGKTYADQAAPFVPLYVWCLLPLTVANILLYNLLARKRYGVGWALGAVVLGYWLALQRFHESPQQIIGTMGGAATMALLVCVVATWRQPKPAAGAPA